MNYFKIEQRGIIKFLTLEGVASEQIFERLQKVYREETFSLSQVEHWATETNDDRRRRRTKLTMLLRDTDVMADVLGFFTRKEIALQLARVNRQFSALCNCWCQPETDNDPEDAEANSVSERVKQRKRKPGQGSKSKR